LRAFVRGRGFGALVTFVLDHLRGFVVKNPVHALRDQGIGVQEEELVVLHELEEAKFGEDVLPLLSSFYAQGEFGAFKNDGPVFDEAVTFALRWVLSIFKIPEERLENIQTSSVTNTTKGYELFVRVSGSCNN
jgi:hypothetical protein